MNEQTQMLRGRETRENLVMDRVRRDTATRAIQTMRTVLDVNPDTFGQAERVSQETGIAAPALVQNPDAMFARERERALERAFGTAPRQAGWIAEDPGNAVYAQDEAEVLAEYGLVGDRLQEEPASALSRGFESGMAGMAQSWDGLRQFAASDVVLRAQTQSELYDTIDALPNPTEQQVRFLLSQRFGDLEPIGQSFALRYAQSDEAGRASLRAVNLQRVVDNEEMIAELTRAMFARALEMPEGEEFSLENFGAWSANVIGQGAPFLATVIGVGALTGPGGAAVAGGGFALGSTTSEASLAGEDIMDSSFRGRALTAAVLSGASEVLLGPVAAVVGRPLRGVPDELVEQAAESLLRSTGREVTQNALEEAGQELFQTLLQEWAVAGRVDTSTESLMSYFESAVAGAILGGPTGGGIELVRGTAERVSGARLSEAQTGEASAERIEEINEVVARTQLRDRSPNRWRRFLQRGGFEQRSLYIDVEPLIEFASAEPETLQALGLTQRQVDQAAEAGTPLAVNLGTYMTNVPGRMPELERLFVDNGRTSVMSESRASAQVIKDQEMAERAEEANAAAEDANLRQDIFDEVLTAVSGQLRAAGRSQQEARAGASLTASFFSTLAARTGDRTVAETYRSAVIGPGSSLEAREQAGGRQMPQAGEAAAQLAPEPRPLPPALPGLEDIMEMAQQPDLDPQVIMSAPQVQAVLDDMKSRPETVQTIDLSAPDAYMSRAYRAPNGQDIAGVEALFQELETLSAAFADGEVRQERRMDILLGPPAAGKSSIAEKFIAPEAGARIVDSDDIKKMIPEFDGGIGAAAVHEESSQLGKIYLDRAMARGDNIVLPKVGDKAASIQKVIQQARDAGYTVNLVNMQVEAIEPFRRNMTRFAIDGRLVPPEYVLSVGDKPTQVYEQLKGEADGYASYDNNVPFGQDPVLTEDTREGSDDDAGRGQDDRPDGRGSDADTAEGGPAPAGADAEGVRQEDRQLNQSSVPLFDEPLQIDAKRITVRDIGQAMTDWHMENYGRKLFPEDSEEDYQTVLESVTQELAEQLSRPNSGAGWYSKDVELAIEQTAKVYPGVATPEGRSVWLTFAGIFSNGLDPSQAWEISAEAFEYWEAFGEIPINRAEAARRLGKEPTMTSYKDRKTGEQVTKPAGWGIRNPSNEQQLQMFANLVEREGGPVQAVQWMLAPQRPDAINEIVLTAQNTPRFKTKAEREGPDQWGALMFSDKLGRYTMGLHGFQITEDDTTVDLWYTRTYRRLTGRLMDKPIGKEGVAAQPDPARGGIERKTIFRMTGDLSRRFGDLPAGDVQAMLWFFEKRLWGAQGLRTDEGTNSAGARRLLGKRGVDFDDGTGGTAQDQPAGAEPAAADAEARRLEQQARGQITIPSDGVANSETVIELFKTADASTYIHEAGHFFLEIMQDVAKQDAAPQQIKDDMRTINEWLGRSPDDTSTFTTEQQEMWAEAFENYLYEGKAPSPSLKAIFSKFAAWLGQVYRQLMRPGTQPSPEIREVMDRMLATDEEIATVRDQRDSKAMFSDIPPGMSQEEYEPYVKLVEREEAETKGRALERAMTKIRRRRTDEWKKREAALRPEIEARLREDRGYIAINLLGGSGPDAAGITGRLDKKRLVDMFGEQILQDLTSERHGTRTNLYTTQGTNPIFVSETLGYKNVVQMINDIRSKKPFKQAVDEQVRQQLDEELADPEDNVSIRDEAEAALKNGFTTERVSRELAALQRMRNTQQRGPTRWQQQNAAAKDMAEERVGELKVREVMNYRQFMRASQQAAREAQRNLSKVVRGAEGRPTPGTRKFLEAAVDAKRKQLLNDHMYRIARDRARRITAARKRFQRIQKKSIQQNIGADFMDAINTLLDKYSFREISIREQNRRVELRQMYEALIEAGRESEIAFDMEVIAELQQQNYMELDADQLEGVIAAIDNLIHMGRATTKQIAEQERRDRNLIFDDIEDRASKNLKEKPQMRERRLRPNTLYRQFQLHVLNADSLLRDIDGEETALGPAYNAVKRAIDRGVGRADERRQEAAQAVAAIFKKMARPAELARMGRELKVYEGIEEHGPISRLGLLALALNAGNEGNWDRVTNPEGMKTYNAERLQRVLVRELSEKEWRFVQEIWDYLDSYWPEISAQERKLTGVAPQKVKHKLMIKGAPEFVRGGYFPIRYDQGLSAVADEQAKTKMLMEGRAGMSARAQTDRGHTNERKAHTHMPVDLDLSIINGHVFNVIQDLELRAPVRDAGMIIYSQRFQNMMNQYGRQEDLRALKSWLEDVAIGDRVAAYGASRWFRWMRGGFTLGAIGFKMSTVLLQVFGITQSLVQVGYVDFTRGFAGYLKQPGEIIRFARENSHIMEERIRTFDKDISQITADITAGNPAAARYERWLNQYIPMAYTAMQMMQFYVVDVPTWYASHEKALRNGESAEDAIVIADRDVRIAQGSGLMSDRGMIERGRLSPEGSPTEVARLFTVLGSYMFGKFNLAYRRVHGTDMKSPKAVAYLARDMMMIFVVEAMLVYLLRNGWPDEDDEDSRYDNMYTMAAGEGFYTALGTMPVLRDISSAVQGWGGGAAYAEYTGAAGGLLSGGAGMFDEEDGVSRRDVEGMVGFGGTFIFLPSGLFTDLMDAIWENDWDVEDEWLLNTLSAATGLPLGGEDES
jgi:predicted ABC-type ATPase